MASWKCSVHVGTFSWNTQYNRSSISLWVSQRKEGRGGGGGGAGGGGGEREEDRVTGIEEGGTQ